MADWPGVDWTGCVLVSLHLARSSSYHKRDLLRPTDSQYEIASLQKRTASIDRKEKPKESVADLHLGVQSLMLWVVYI